MPHSYIFSRCDVRMGMGFCYNKMREFVGETHHPAKIVIVRVIPVSNLTIEANSGDNEKKKSKTTSYDVEDHGTNNLQYKHRKLLMSFLNKPYRS